MEIFILIKEMVGVRTVCMGEQHSCLQMYKWFRRENQACAIRLHRAKLTLRKNHVGNIASLV